MILTETDIVQELDIIIFDDNQTEGMPTEMVGLEADCLLRHKGIKSIIRVSEIKEN